VVKFLPASFYIPSHIYGEIMPREPSKPTPPPDDPEQSKRFIELAREVGADGTKEEFDRALKKVAKARTSKPPKPD
jgi:hypothetical protein